jgi:hypothetical protein
MARLPRVERTLLARAPRDGIIPGPAATPAEEPTMPARLVPLILAAAAWRAVPAAEVAPPPAPPAPAAEQPAAAPAAAAPALDAATVRRAEQAADAYLTAQSTRPDPEAEHALAEAEIGLLEANAFLDQHQPLKAGDQYLLASGKLAAIPAEQRAALGQRFRKASAGLTGLSKRLLDEQAFNLGPPAPEPARRDDGAR